MAQFKKFTLIFVCFIKQVGESKVRCQKIYPSVHVFDIGDVDASDDVYVVNDVGDVDYIFHNDLVFVAVANVNVVVVFDVSVIVTNFKAAIVTGVINDVVVVVVVQLFLVLLLPVLLLLLHI